jgi:hypothetical protein
MKQLLVIFLLLSLKTFAQSDTAIKYTGIVSVDNTNKDQLYQRARAWFNDAFKNSKAVLQIQDKTTGELSGKGIISATYKVGNRLFQEEIDFDVKVLTKDGRFKYEFSNFKDDNLANSLNLGLLTSSPTCSKKFPMVRQSRVDGSWNDIKASVNTTVTGLIDDLKKSINKPVDDF